jgi:ABC-type phosphate transport system permease subunit
VVYGAAGVQDLIVLGIIPGTDVQINFMVWLVLFLGVVAAVYMTRRERSKHTVLLLLIWASLTLGQRRRERA